MPYKNAHDPTPAEIAAECRKILAEKGIHIDGKQTQGGRRKSHWIGVGGPGIRQCKAPFHEGDIPEDD